MRINEGKVHRITSVKSAGDRAVRLRFDSGKTYTVDLRVLVRHSRGLKALRGASLFARVALGEGGHSIAGPAISISVRIRSGSWPLNRTAGPMRSSSSAGAGVTD